MRSEVSEGYDRLPEDLLRDLIDGAGNVTSHGMFRFLDEALGDVFNI